MTDLTHTVAQPSRRIEFKRILSYLARPRSESEKLAAEERPSWLTPMLLLSLTLLLAVAVGGFVQARAAAMGEVQLPPSVAVYTPLWLPAFALFFATLIGLISGLYPALRAATMVPVLALKYE